MTIDIEEFSKPGQIRLLLAIAQTTSFTAAAAQMGVSQPFVSAQVRRLEAQSGRPLFKRGRRGVALTPEGEAVLVYMRAMSHLSEDLRRQLTTMKGRISIKIALAEDFCRTALPRVLKVFMQYHPEVELHVLSGPYDQLEEGLGAGTIDFGVLRRSAGNKTASLLWAEPMTWVGHAGLRQPLADPVPLVLPIGPTPAREVVLEALRSAGRQWRVMFESHSLSSMEAALQAGLGVFVTPCSMQLSEVEPLPQSHLMPTLPDVEYVLVERPSRPPIGACQAFVEIVRQVAASRFHKAGGTMNSSPNPTTISSLDSPAPGS